MCGIAALLNLDQHATPVARPLIERMRDRLSHRGPDDSGLWEGPQGSIAHRRLIVIDPTPSGHQPFVSPDGRYVLAYNGELYNDHDLRSQLATLGVRFRTHCDTETLLHALITWGDGAIDKLRGMYAFVFLDTVAGTATLARDPLGIKPLYHTLVESSAGRQLLIASEIPALLTHPLVSPRPDPVTLSAYLSSIRTTLGERTLYQGISTLTPGQWMSIPLDHPSRAISRSAWDTIDRTPTQPLRESVEESVHRHLRTDVPMCALLSGGLDSAITTLIASRSLDGLSTFCAGARDDGFSDDFAFAAGLARELGTNHTEVEITQGRFLSRWAEMIDRLAMPLSTPNEVAIHEVAVALRARGNIVALSGEGADELLGGYAPIMHRAAAHVRSLDGADDSAGGLFHLAANAWVSEELKPGILREHWYGAADADSELRQHYTRAFNEARDQSPRESPLQAHLRFQRRMNLPNLLQRLDTSTMLASVEGRTPYADIEVAICAESLPIDQKYIDHDDMSRAQTKIALRRAFASELPSEIVNRPKASFPLPFQHWMSPIAEPIFESPFAREIFTDQAIGLVSTNPQKYWHLAWPMLNLVLWGDTVFVNRNEDPAPCSGKPASSTTCS